MHTFTVSMRLILIAAVAFVAAGAVAQAEPPTEGVIVFERGGDLWRINADTTNEVRLTKTKSHETDPVVSPDGNWIAYARSRSGNERTEFLTSAIWSMTIDGKKVKRLTDKRGNAIRNRVASEFTPSFSPDGRKIAYTVVESSVDNFDYYPRTSYIWTMKPTGKGKRKLNTHEYDDRPVFMANGRIAFHGYKSRNDVYSMTAAGKDRTQLPELRFYDYDLAFSPDGTRVAFANRSRENLDCYDLYTVGVDGLGLAKIEDSPICEVAPSWSPDSAGIVFARSNQSEPCAKDSQLIAVEPDGTDEVPITPGCNPFWAAG